MPSDGVEAGSADGGAEHRDDDDGVVGVAEDRDEVGDEVDGQGQVGQQEAQSDADAAGQVAVSGRSGCGTRWARTFRTTVFGARLVSGSGYGGSPSDVDLAGILTVRER